MATRQRKIGNQEKVREFTYFSGKMIGGMEWKKNQWVQLRVLNKIAS